MENVLLSTHSRVMPFLHLESSHQLGFESVMQWCHCWCHQDLTFCVISQDYPKNRHPGWSRGSIAYHAGECWLITMVHDVFSLQTFAFRWNPYYSITAITGRVSCSVLYFGHIYRVSNSHFNNSTKLSLMFPTIVKSADLWIFYHYW